MDVPETDSTDQTLNILVDTIRIFGFRGIKNLEITLEQKTLLIGPNNSGKTTVLKALNLALGNYGRYLSEEDFHIGIDDDEKSTDEIIVDIRIIPLGGNGKRASIFEDNWQMEFGDQIKAEANGKQYVAMRTIATSDEVKGGFKTERFFMGEWPDSALWNKYKVGRKTTRRMDSIPFFSIKAQRDIHTELKDKSSFIGKVLSRIKYNKDLIDNLEKEIEEINKKAVDNCAELQRLKEHLEQLNQTFQGTGIAEITPFPKKVRDLSKNFSIHFGETAQSTFSMEYHGMGTRSSATMMTVIALIENLRSKHEEESEPFFPILSAEEPEAHLHPNAQKTLFKLLLEPSVQVIFSTHSPYLVAVSDLSHVRSLKKTQQGITVSKLEYNVSVDEKKVLAREILARRGEILFSRALILCEGMTEEQVIPAMFEKYCKNQLFMLGVSCVSVGGQKYAPFIKLACSLGIPTFIVSDNDENTKIKIEKQFNKLPKEVLSQRGEIFDISYCSDGNDFEKEIVDVLRIIPEIKKALILKDSKNEQHARAKMKELNSLSDEELYDKIKNGKTGYSSFLADIIRKSPENRKPEELIPQYVLDAFNRIKEWLKL